MEITTSVFLGRRNPDGSPRLRLTCIILGAAGAGKTSILRRYFHNTFHEGSRVPTLGSDFYTGRVSNPVHVAASKRGEGDDEKKDVSDSPVPDEDWISSIVRQPFLSLQMWDTAGRERFVAGRKMKYTATLSDDFFRHADAAMLVYDATSSTSFTQLLKWHSDLMHRIQTLREADDDGHAHPFPVLIVANKMDIFKRDIAEPKRRNTVPQRDVMGLSGNFRGKNFRYEYRASPPARENKSSSKNSRRFEISTYMTTGDSTWTTDGSYLDSVLNTEDRSHPDRDMVLLWCLRNGLKHLEVSALDGSGINAAFEALVILALQSANDRERSKIRTPAADRNSDSRYRTNRELDLHQRYAPKEENCRVRLFPFCKS